MSLHSRFAPAHVPVDLITACVYGPTLSAPPEYGDQRVAHLYGKLDALGEVPEKLYFDSAKSCMHLEGNGALWGIREMLQRFRSAGTERVSNEQMAERVTAVLQLSQRLFALSDELGIVVFHGSAARGVPKPNDFDVLVGTKRNEFYEDNRQRRSLGFREQQKLTKSGINGAELLGLKIHAGLYTHYEFQRVPIDFAKMYPNQSEGLVFAGNGPYLAIVPNPNDSTCPLIFFNDAGHGYEQERISLLSGKATRPVRITLP